MRALILIILALVAPASFAKEGPVKGSFVFNLKKHEGKERVLMVFAPSKSHEKFKQQWATLKGRYAEFRTGKAVIYFAFASDEVGRADDLYLRPVDARDLRKSFQISESDFQVLLIDRTGKVTKKFHDPIDKATLERWLKS